LGVLRGAKTKQDKAQSLFALRDHSYPQCGQHFQATGWSLFSLAKLAQVAF